MLSTLSAWLFGGSDLAPHGYCLLWEPSLIWLYAISDGAIALAYFSIPLSLFVVGRRRSDLVFRPLLWLFAAFILLCGTTHWLDLATLWTPLYGLQGAVKAATAVASVATAAALWWALPQFLALPSTAQLQQANAALLASEERLAHAQKMEAIGQLTGGIAHDFNNVLQVIVGSLTVIERQVARGRGNDIMPAAAAIRRASNTASNLVNRLLAFSRRQTLLPRVIEPDRLIVGMVEMLQRTLGPEIELDLQLGKPLQTVNCDPSQLESALLNLAINARDAMPQGGMLKISTADRLSMENLPDPDAKPGDYVEIEVADSGAGMSPDVLSHAFEPFFTTKPTGQGTGLGLSQIYGFVKQSGGFVRIESRPGAGTSVHIYLPGHEAEPERERASAPAEKPPELPAAADATGCLPTGCCKNEPSENEPGKTGAGRTEKRRTVLIVEDQGEIRAQLADTLRDIGCAVIEAADGLTALKIVESGAMLDMLVTDIGLPGLGGRQLAETAHKAKPDLPILLITGYAGKPTEALRLAPNMELMRKPFSLDELAERVQAMLQKTTVTTP